MKFRHAAALALASVLLGGCYQRKVNTLQTWCERGLEISQNPNGDPDERHRPFWAIFYSVQIDQNRIRDDFVKFLNNTYLEKVQKRTSRMVWREGKVLHVVNLSSLLVINPSEFIESWQKGIAKAQSLKSMDPADECLWGTVFQLFDSVQIHSLTTDPVGKAWGDMVTSIPTRRRQVFVTYSIDNSDLNGWYMLVPPLTEGPPKYPACDHDLVPTITAPQIQWGIEGSFSTAKECEEEKDRTRKLGQTGVAEAAQTLKPMRKEPPDAWSWFAPICSGLARSRQLAQAVCVSTDDPRLNEPPK